MIVAEQLRELYETQKLSIPQIANLTNNPRSRIRKWLICFSISIRSRGDGVRLRAYAIGDRHRGRIHQPFSAEHRRKLSEAKLRSKKTRGWSIKPNGYKEFTAGPHKGRLEHDVIVEQRIGRRLLPNEIVHHKNEIRHDNDPENLELMTRAEHTRLHQLLRKLHRNELK